MLRFPAVILILLALFSYGAEISPTPKPIIIAHRGASGYLPEHTLEAKAVAHAMGADFIEQDIVITKDDVPIGLHDIMLESTTDVAKRFPDRKRADGHFYALDFTLAEVKQLRANERINPKTGAAVFPKRFPVSSASFQIPTLEEELQLIQGLNKSTGREAGIYPEIKQPSWHLKQGHDISAFVLPILRRYGYATKRDACWIQCFDVEETKRIRADLGWQGRLVLLLEAQKADADSAAADKWFTPDGLAEIARFADGIGPALSSVISGKSKATRKPTDLVRHAHAANLVVHPYTLRADDLPPFADSLRDATASLFNEAHADGVFTDFPDQVISAGFVAANNRSKPNIVVIYGDDIGVGDFSCYGSKAVSTPNVDRLAARGLRFTSAYSTAATCTPSRYSLLTGEYAFRKPGTGILAGDAKLIIRPGRETLPGMLQRAGYRTGVVGKWHLGLGEGSQPLDWNADIRPGPLEVGFDHAFIMAATGDRVPCVFIENHRVAGLSPSDPISVSYQNPFPGMPTGKSHRDGLAMDWSQGHNDAIVNGIGRIGHMKGGSAAIWKDDMMAKDFTHQAVEFIRREKDRPFFLLFATHDDHVPRVPHKDFTGKTTMGARGDAIAQFDWSVGQILEALDVLKILDNTLVIVSSDNGPVLDDGYKDGAAEKVGDHKPAGPFRGGKYSLFEGGTRSPFITHWPARIKPGVSGALISQVDLLASLASLTKQSVPTADAPDSQNQLDALLGDSTTGRDSLLLHAGGIAIRQGDWKYIPAGRTRDKLGPWTEIQIPEPGLLFNLSTDPGETNNLAATHPDLLQQMQITLERARRTPH